jgi:IPT/TIG domain
MNAPMLAAALATASQNDPAVSAGSKAWAILIGVAFLILLYVVTALITGHRNPKELVNGFDGFASTSKLQWFLWLIVILFAYTALWVLRAEQGDYSALGAIPVNLLTVLGFSTGTAAAAKGITSSFTQTGKMTKPGAPPTEPSSNTGGIFQDDGGGPELAKIQMMGFTIIAIGIFLATVIHQIAIGDVKDSLPNIDSSLMVLMGISQGGYLGKKLVTFGTPTLYPPSPMTGSAGDTVTLRGANLGSQQGSQLLLNGMPIDAIDGSWTSSSIKFIVPDANPDGGTAWKPPAQPVKIAVSIMGQTSNSADFTVTSKSGA